MRIPIPNHFPLKGSGSSIYTLNLAQELVRLGHEVLVGLGQIFEEMTRLACELVLQNAHSAGHQPPPIVARIYNLADISVVPSRVERSAWWQ